MHTTVCDNNVYKAQMCDSYLWLSVQDDGPVEVTTLKDELPDP